MGNTTSDVNDSLKAQAGGDGPEIYKFINLSCGGELVRLTENAIKTKDYSQLDEVIKTRVVEYLYNNGEGADIPIEQMVLKRTNGRVPTQRPGVNKSFDKVGAVGESLLHLCLLNGTKVHLELAKRLLKWYPKQVYDIYLSDDYFGEAPLHMAIVSEDVTMVRILLVNGSDVHQRCCGKFFCPEDQKTTKTDSLESFCPILTVNTNYMGYSYFGEYPLSFAAILNQKECVRLLIAKGADPKKQDSNGNTVLHMLVINNNMHMFNFMLEFDVSLDIKNRQGLTPLTLAAKLARKEMFQFILEHMRKIMWIYADISCAAYPLPTIDTIDLDGKTDTNSALHLIANGESEEHLELLEGLVVDLLYRKWNTYIKTKFYLEFLIFSVYFILSGTVLLMKRLYFDYLGTIECTHVDESLTRVIESCQCAYLYQSDPNRHVRTILEIILIMYSIAYLVVTFTECFVQRLSLYIQTLLFNPSKIFFILSHIATILMIPMRYNCSIYGEDYLMVISIIFKSLYILYLGRGFRVITTFVFIIHQVIRTNFVRFIIIFWVFLLGFSQAFYVTYEYGREPVNEIFSSPLQSILDLLVMSLHDLSAAYENLIVAKYAIVGRFLFVVYIIIVSILLINMLIAMMASTYDTTTEMKREWLRQWAKQVLSIEQNVSAKERIKQQKKYSHIMANGEKSFIVHWKQTEEERNQIISQKNIFQQQIQNLNCDLN